MSDKQVWFNSRPMLNRSEIEVVYHVLNPIGTFHDADEIASSIVASLQADFNAEIVGVFRLGGVSPSTVELVKAIDVQGPSRYLSKVISGRLEMEWGFLPLMVADFQPRAFDFSMFPDYQTARYLLKTCGIQGGVCVPIVLDGAMRGFFSMLFEAKFDELSEQEASFLTMVGGALGAALEYCELLESFNAYKQGVSSLGGKSEEINDHVVALRHLLDDISYLTTKPVEEMIHAVDKPRDMVQPFANLTQGELNALALIAAGYSNGEIAERLFISEGTVKKRIGNIMMKLNLKNRTQLGVYYARFAR